MGVDPIKDYEEKKAEEHTGKDEAWRYKMQSLQQVLPLHTEAEEPYEEEAHREDTIFLWGV